MFAGLREAAGRKELALELSEGASLAAALERVAGEVPVVERYRGRLVVSVNERPAAPDTVLGDGDEIALLPPMSGGSDRVRLQASPLSLDALLALVRGPDCGGEVTFTGVVRDHSRGERIRHLEYEAYEPMALRELQAIEAQVAARWPGVRIAIAHRIGHLEIGEAAVMIAAVAPHRAQAFEACRFAIDTLKATVPIWKKEFGESGACWVEENP
jgi:molybdopterin synthase catalytic subunit